MMIYSADGRAVSPPPTTFTRFRVEFDQPIDASGVQATSQNNLLTVANAAAGSSTYAYCSPPASTQPIKFFDNTGGTDRPIEISACYNPTSQLGKAPAILIVPAKGQIAAAAAGSAFTCNSFDPETAATGFTAKSDTTYAIVIDPNSIANSSDSSKKLQVPSGAGWTTGTGGARFAYKTAKFDIMAAGGQNSVTGYFDWIDKPYLGFMPDIAAIAPSAEIDCDPAASVSQNGCRIFSDGSAFIVLTTHIVDDTTLTTSTITRTDGSTFDSFVTTDGGQQILAGSHGTFEPGQDYKVTLDVANIKDVDGNALAAPGTPVKSYTFTAGSGPNGPGHFAEILAITPSGGATNQDPTLAAGVNARFQFPVDPTTAQNPANWIVKVNGTAVPGTPAIDAGTNNQNVTWTPTTPPSPALFGATVTVRIQNIKIGPGTTKLPASTTFTAFDSSFVTSRFHIDDILATATPIGGRKNAPADILTSGNLTVAFNDDVNMSTVTDTTLVLKDAAGATIPKTITPAGTKAVKITATAALPAVFNTSYTITATSGIKSASGTALNEETCATTGCSDTRAITTLSLSIGTPSNPRAASGVLQTFTIVFNTAVDPTTVTPQLGNIKLLEIARLPDNRAGTPNGTSIPLTCTLGADNKTITCTLGGAGKVNTYYQVLAPFTNVKPATTFNTKPVDPAYSFTGTATRTTLTGC